MSLCGALRHAAIFFFKKKGAGRLTKKREGANIIFTPCGTAMPEARGRLFDSMREGRKKIDDTGYGPPEGGRRHAGGLNSIK